MNQTIKGVLISVVISFTVPTLVVASQWGSYQANQEAIMKQLEKIDKKVDKVDDKLNITREEMSLLKGQTMNSS